MVGGQCSAGDSGCFSFPPPPQPPLPSFSLAPPPHAHDVRPQPSIPTFGFAFLALTSGLRRDSSAAIDSLGMSIRPGFNGLVMSGDVEVLGRAGLPAEAGAAGLEPGSDVVGRGLLGLTAVLVVAGAAAAATATAPAGGSLRCAVAFFF